MSYSLEFKRSALEEWRSLGATVREQRKTKLRERLRNPNVPSARLAGMPDCYKTKLRAAGYRLVYQVSDRTVTVVVVAIGKRERGSIYLTAIARLSN
jgi:mRNA interferase RelE/StbE